MLYLPQYWPELASVELAFGVVKQRLKDSEEYRRRSFNSKEGRKLIMKAYWEIRGEPIIKMWIQVIKKAKEYAQENSTNF